MGATAIDCHMSQVISLLIHQSRAHRGHIQYEHDLLQLYYNVTSNEKKKTVHGKKKNQKKKKKNQQH
jgi:hypothetical protein